jgi:hypothetical protein
MPCTTPNCPASKASAPRREHADHCKYAAARSGQGAPVIRVREDLADELQRIKAAKLEDDAVKALRKVT